MVGGAGTLRIGEAGPLVKDTADFPAEFKAEAEEMGAVLGDLKTAAHAKLDWFFVSPAAGFGSWTAGVAIGKYRTGGDELLVNADGRSEISGADLADAAPNEIESPAHRRRRFTVVYLGRTCRPCWNAGVSSLCSGLLALGPLATDAYSWRTPTSATGPRHQLSPGLFPSIFVYIGLALEKRTQLA